MSNQYMQIGQPGCTHSKGSLPGSCDVIPMDSILAAGGRPGMGGGVLDRLDGEPAAGDGESRIQLLDST